MEATTTIEVPSFFFKMKEIEGFEDAVIAGGFVRDQYLGKPFKDVDIFIPIRGQTDFIERMVRLNDAGFTFTRSQAVDGYRTNKFLGKYDGTVDGLDVDIVGQKMSPKGFGHNLVETFNFGLDRIYLDGKEVALHPDFENDIKYQLINLRDVNGIDDLPNAMHKYFRLKEKYPSYNFTSSYTLEKRRGDDWL